MKIAVYAISKNESAFVERFCSSAKDADLILIADTGSTDNTVQLARACGATAPEICISPWRFDKARDAALALIPKDIDICISLDLDEVLEHGWREEIERVWQPDTTRLRYRFDWGAGVVFYSDKIHSRHGYHWHHPCHEALRPDARIKEVTVQTDRLLVTHYPDHTKSRGQYIDLLELSVKEDPHCPRNAFYYARELTFYQRWPDAILALKRYLDMPSATWAVERSYAMRLLGQAYDAVGEIQEAQSWLEKSAKTDPNAREPLLALSDLARRTEQWELSYHNAKAALQITDQQSVYTMDPAAWGAKPHDLLALAAYYLGKYDEAARHGQIACELDPKNSRLAQNMKFYVAKKDG